MSGPDSHVKSPRILDGLIPVVNLHEYGLKLHTTMYKKAYKSCKFSLHGWFVASFLLILLFLLFQSIHMGLQHRRICGLKTSNLFGGYLKIRTPPFCNSRGAHRKWILSKQILKADSVELHGTLLLTVT